MEGGNGLINRPNEAQAIVCWGHGSGQLFNCRQEPELRVRVDLVGLPQRIVSIYEDHCRTVAGGHLLFYALYSWACDLGASGDAAGVPSTFSTADTGTVQTGTFAGTSALVAATKISQTRRIRMDHERLICAGCK